MLTQVDYTELLEQILLFDKPYTRRGNNNLESHSILTKTKKTNKQKHE